MIFIDLATMGILGANSLLRLAGLMERRHLSSLGGRTGRVTVIVDGANWLHGLVDAEQVNGRKWES